VLPRLSIGGAVHILSGSVQRIARRIFLDASNYHNMEQANTTNLSGTGWSAGVAYAPIPEISIAASYRSDSKLKSRVTDTESGTVDLPVSYSGGIFLQLHPSIMLATSVERKMWSSADADLEASGGANAFDTWSVGSGLELGGASGLPLRVGARYAQLPFSPSNEQARELGFSGGTAMRFAGGRASLEASVERILRDGAGAEERAWYLMFALTVMP
jgi:long-subunit fatty acid transport protein